MTASDGDTLVAEGRPADMDLEVPAPPSSAEAAEASRAGYEQWSDRHPFPECAVCGPEREPGDGLRLFPGRLGDGGLFACAWTPDAFVAGADGTVLPECVWAALDCPSSAPARIEPGSPPVVLGRLQASLDGRVEVGETHAILSWALERAGRKSITAAALFDSHGRILARARAVWIELRGN